MPYHAKTANPESARGRRNWRHAREQRDRISYRSFILTTTLCFFASFAYALPDLSILPPERRAVWNPGLNAVGGIPARTTICATIDAAAYGSGTQDATAGIQAAIDACPAGEVVQLSAGNFRMDSVLQINKGITLRGQGPALTKLKMPFTTGINVITIGTQWPGFGQSVNLAADAVKGNQSVTLASNPGLSVGEIVLLDQLTDTSITRWSPHSPPGHASRGWRSRYDRPVAQVMEVASIGGDTVTFTVTFTTPFHIDFKTSSTAQLTRFTEPAVKYAGVEDLYVEGGNGGQQNIKFGNAAYSWVKNVESTLQVGHSIGMYYTFRSVVRDSYIHTAQESVPGGGAYGLSISEASSDNLVENNIVWNQNKVMTMEASGGGNVIAYNYMEDGWIEYAPIWVETGLNAAHMTTPHYELFEGNQAFNFDGDNTWGNSIYITAFRNHLTAKRRSVPPVGPLIDEQNRRAVGLMEGHWWYSIIGNVLGTADQDPWPMSAFTYEDSYPWTDDPIGMWRLGYNPENWDAPADPTVLSTLIRGGNFDYATHSVKWENLSEQSLPDSLYLDSKPSFFGSNTWPWVDPTGSTKVHTLPARARFDAIIAPGPDTTSTTSTASDVTPKNRHRLKRK